MCLINKLVSSPPESIQEAILFGNNVIFLQVKCFEDLAMIEVVS